MTISNLSASFGGTDFDYYSSNVGLKNGKPFLCNGTLCVCEVFGSTLNPFLYGLNYCRPALNVQGEAKVNFTS